MAHRPIRRKQANRLRKALRREIPAHIDLIAFLRDRGFAQTAGAARNIILAGRVRAGDDTLGIVTAKQPKGYAVLKAAVGGELADDDFEEVPVVQPYVSAKLRGTIEVLAA